MIPRSILAALRGEYKHQNVEELMRSEEFRQDYRIVDCPVCGRKTFDDYWICSGCGWEYDDYPEDHYSSCNGATLREYREQYQKALHMRSVFIGGSKSCEELTLHERDLLFAYMDVGYHILIGDCRGIDRAVQCYFYLREYENVTVYATEGKVRNNLGGWHVKSIPAEGKTGLTYYRQKDIAMANDANEALMFWDGKSKGTYYNLLDMLNLGKPARVVLRPFEVVEITSIKDTEKIRNS